MKRAVTLLMLITLAGCSSTPSGSPTTAHAVPTFAAGASALAMARAIADCKSAAELPVESTAKGLSSLAGCSLGGFPIEVFSWDSASDTSPSSEFDGNGTEYYSVDGPTWTVLAGVDGDLAGQKTAMEAVVKSIGGKVVHVTP